MSDSSYTLSDWHGYPDTPKGTLRLSVPGDENLPPTALIHPGSNGIGIISLHGYNNHSDQLFRCSNLSGMRDAIFSQGFGVLAPELGGNLWMNPDAMRELDALLAIVRREFAWKRLVVTTGSMGGTGALIYAVNRPHAVDAILCAASATDIARYAKWCESSDSPLCREIGDSIRAAYNGDPEAYPDHRVTLRADRISVPLLLTHGSLDAVIPVEESRALAKIMEGRPGFRYREFPGGDHDVGIGEYPRSLEEIMRMLEEHAK